MGSLTGPERGLDTLRLVPLALTGDVQPYIALSLALVAHGHRVRLATHGEFKDFVKLSTNATVEFFDLGGDPRRVRTRPTALLWRLSSPPTDWYLHLSGI